jgi:hypothetical protein
MKDKLLKYIQPDMRSDFLCLLAKCQVHWVIWNGNSIFQRINRHVNMIWYELQPAVMTKVFLLVYIVVLSEF